MARQCATDPVTVSETGIGVVGDPTRTEFQLITSRQRLEPVVRALAGVSERAVLTVVEDGLRVAVTNADHTSLVDAWYPEEVFEQFDAETPGSVCLKSDDLLTAFTAMQRDRVALEASRQPDVDGKLAHPRLTVTECDGDRLAGVAETTAPDPDHVVTDLSNLSGSLTQRADVVDFEPVVEFLADHDLRSASRIHVTSLFPIADAPSALMFQSPGTDLDPVVVNSDGGMTADFERDRLGDVEDVDPDAGTDRERSLMIGGQAVYAAELLKKSVYKLRKRDVADTTFTVEFATEGPITFERSVSRNGKLRVMTAPILD